MTNHLPRPTLLATLAASAVLLPTLVYAHPGHGMDGSHWHATDAFGLAALAAVFGAAVWWARRK